MGESAFGASITGSTMNPSREGDFMTRKLSKILCAAVLALLCTIMFAPPASAGVGVGNETYSPQVQTLRQCPFDNCNPGQAYLGNHLAEVCVYWPDEQWALVFNGANLHTGFIRSSLLRFNRTVPDCGTLSPVHPTSWFRTLYQCPALNCNQGQAPAYSNVVYICQWGGPGNWWIWALNRDNKHEGFLPTNAAPGLPTC
jgi:hypothetical protein